MASSILIVGVALVAYWLYSTITGLQKNIAAAKRSGLPYVVSPFYLYDSLWMALSELLIPLIKKLPKSWSEGWIDYVQTEWTWRLPFEQLKKKGDSFIVVAPAQMIIYLANAEAIRQVAARREAFPKPLESYKILEIFGRNLLSTEGAEWKMHRKISSPSFNETNNVLVFAEATKQAQGMLRKWTSVGNATIEEVPTDTMRLTLHIISKIGFGVSLLWPGEKPSGKQSMRDAELSSNEPPEGHTLSFEESISTLLDYIILVLLLPKWLLKALPFKATSKAYKAYFNWKQYMNELFAQKMEEAREGKTTEGMDIMGSLVRSSYGNSAQNQSCASAEKGEPNIPKLSDSDILGNAFVMIVAGHETTANSIHFSLMELAINPKSQRGVQQEIQNIFGDAPPEKWEYESSINSLLGGLVGAVLNEQLRLMPPVIAIPKHVTKSSDQTINIDGQKITLPAGARVALATPLVARNPRYWPTESSKVTDRADDLEDFKPERWLVKAAHELSDSGSDQENDEEFGAFTGRDSHAQLFRPVRGSYLPFSEGPRSCIGRRLAQVKAMAIFATIFQGHSIELAVDEWATDDEVAKMSKEEKRDVYKKAQLAARATIRTATSQITLKLHGKPGFIPVRVVRKGEERFINFVE